MDNSPLQVMDLTSLKAVLVDLRKKIIPSRFEKAQQLEANTLQLAFRTIESVVWVELSWDASSARLVEIPPPARSFGESTLATDNCVQRTYLSCRSTDNLFSKNVERANATIFYTRHKQ